MKKKKTLLQKEKQKAKDCFERILDVEIFLAYSNILFERFCKMAFQPVLGQGLVKMNNVSKSVVCLRPGIM